MRLKGGKLLLDLSEFDIKNDISKHLSKEEINAIIEKGVIVKIRYDKHLLYYPLIPSTYDIFDSKINLINYNNVNIRDGELKTWAVALNVSDETLGFTEE